MSEVSHPTCVFCALDERRVFLRESSVAAVWDGFPVSSGHALLIPTRHVPNWFEATTEEKMALVMAIDRAKRIIDRQYQPDGYNIGINCGSAAGQTVFHLHVHLIPRYRGDVTDPRGGVRYVIPSKANYSGDGLP